jgi:uncharacterized protein YecT (DUF1311 family)
MKKYLRGSLNKWFKSLYPLTRASLNQTLDSTLEIHMRICWPLVATLLVLTGSARAADQKSCGDKARTQYELNNCSSDELRKVDAELNALYQLILTDYADDPKFIEKLKIAQRAWVKFRDAEMEALFPPHNEDPNFYGSVQPMCESNWLVILTKQRIEQLKKWADRTKEGDICSGSIKIKGNLTSRSTRRAIAHG